MVHIFNFIRFAIYIPLSIALFWCIIMGITFLLDLLVGLSLFWFIILILFGGSALIWGIAIITAFSATALSKINPYKNLGKYIVIPLIILFTVLLIVMFWKNINASSTKGFMTGLIYTGMVAYSALGFCSSISASEEDKIF